MRLPKIVVTSDGDIIIRWYALFFMTVSTPYYTDSEWFVGGTTFKWGTNKSIDIGY